ncbi:hypothetical protein LVY65_09000 [Sphingomonas sp. G124]|uniref:Uncharacterized protein n=1 Tax=Sphingomonas cremea TaxID=2904799 RepID=A0A9X1QM38_9SPHN|nr:hypothetical protein [Sphingomonas cremea]MCF2515196.1 hypothetical protein [Sphingomonas cremea]
MFWTIRLRQHELLRRNLQKLGAAVLAISLSIGLAAGGWLGVIARGKPDLWAAWTNWCAIRRVG